MKILAIETSCDETAIAIIEVKKEDQKTNFEILGNDLASQIELHTQYGGVFPMMAKREHGRNIFNIFEKVLKQAKLHQPHRQGLGGKEKTKLEEILERESDLSNIFIQNINKIKKPKIDAIAVTTGPGLEPALWVGINFAKALAYYWDLPIVPVNHMEGHIFSIFPKEDNKFIIDQKENIFPMLSLLVSGGHTELVLIEDWMKYKKLGQTRDDAAGEAFDKVARMLDLPYPGGPEISKLAKVERNINQKTFLNFPNFPKGLSFGKPQRKVLWGGLGHSFPRPMINSKNYDFSFSGLKTAVLYYLRDHKDANKNKVAKEFEDAVVETLVTKTIRATKEYKIKTLIVGGGVSANKHLQKSMKKEFKNTHFPSKNLSTDNAIMIAIAGYFQWEKGKYIKNYNELVANGNLSL